MIIKPRIRGFLCTTAHPAGCAAEVDEQIRIVQSAGRIQGGPRRVLIIGASGGYGLATRVTAAFGCGADTLGVFFERPAEGNRTASPGWYKSAAFTERAEAAGLYAANFAGDAFSAATKERVIEEIRSHVGQVDMVVYSLAAGARMLPDGSLARSALKPLGEPFSGTTIDLNTGEMRELSLEPAAPEEVADTVKVMGGEDWELWIAALLEADVLARGCVTTNYTYLGSEVTWPIYHHGTIGKAKEDLDRAAGALAGSMAKIGGTAYVCVMKGLMTQAASAIPGMSLYLSLLFKIMKEQGTHEDCIDQTARLFNSRLFAGGDVPVDESGRVRLDDWELTDEVQDYVRRHWHEISNDNLETLTDFAGYRQAFLSMHGFDVAGVDYSADVDANVSMNVISLP